MEDSLPAFCHKLKKIKTTEKSAAPFAIEVESIEIWKVVEEKKKTEKVEISAAAFQSGGGIGGLGPRKPAAKGVSPAPCCTPYCIPPVLLTHISFKLFGGISHVTSSVFP